MNVLLLCNGKPPSRTLCRRLAGKSDLIVAADGGANVARRYGIRPDVIIGDLDSVSQATRKFFSTVHTVRIKRQDSTDLEKALSYIAEREGEHVTILGATGKRLDFTLGNLSVFWNYTSRMNISFAGDKWTALPVGRKLSMKVRRGTTVSLIPFDRCSGITLSGLRFPLKNATMSVGQIGVSNVVTGTRFSVSVRQGKMLLLILDDTVIR